MVWTWHIYVYETVVRIKLAFSDFLVLHAMCKLSILQRRFHLNIYHVSEFMQSFQNMSQLNCIMMIIYVEN